MTFFEKLKYENTWISGLKFLWISHNFLESPIGISFSKNFLNHSEYLIDRIAKKSKDRNLGYFYLLIE